MGVQKSLASKLRTARSITALSTRAVAKLLEPLFPISHSTIANYEKGVSVPPLDVLAALSKVYDRPLNWFLEPSKGLSGVRYRNVKSKTKSSDLLCFEAGVQRWIDAYVAIESRLNRRLKPKIDIKKIKVTEDLASLAQDIRRKFGIGEDEPIASIISVLEGFGVRVIEVESDVKIDGLAARYGDEYIVALNPKVPHERHRLNAAHELAHILLGDCEGAEDSPELEQRAFELASLFLLPNRQLKLAFEGLSMVRLVQFKERFGISLAAMVYRAEKLEFIKKTVAKHLWIEFSRRGWRTNEPGRVQEDRATRFEQLVEELLTSGAMSLKEVADTCGVCISDVQQRLSKALGLEDSSEGPEGLVFSFPRS